MSRSEVARRLASLYDRRSLRHYVRSKVASDPVYEAVLQLLRDRDTPLIDLGCGAGILAFYLREHGYRAPVLGIDFDPRKIEVARKAARNYRDIDFVTGDARHELPANHDVVLLDLLHYLDAASQQQILRNVARSAKLVIIRQGIRDDSWRYRFTAIMDAIGRGIRWMRAENLHYPTREAITGAFAGFDAQVSPLWGRTPFNSYLFVFRRASSEGMTNA
ncbi:MAG TPA: class I SAM-dependent methyltransferase [Thermoanaerobaculia bacterium]|nr:class I SAM-dependent methyltransferase [Thermoanaerobaculia bacterium]